MKKLTYSLSLTAFCLALNFSNAYAASANNTENLSCWGSFKARIASCCTKENWESFEQKVVQEVIPVAEAFIQIAPFSDTVKTTVLNDIENIKRWAAIAGTLIEQTSNGGFKVTLQNGISFITTSAWQLAIKENLGLFTPESKMMLSVLNSLIPPLSKNAIMVQLVPLVVMADDPKTYDTFVYDETTGELVLSDVRGVNIGSTVNFSGALADNATKISVNKVLIEYTDAIQRRTKDEETTAGKRADKNYFAANSYTAITYSALEASSVSNPLSLLIDVAKGTVSIPSAIEKVSNDIIASQPSAIKLAPIPENESTGPMRV